MEFDTSSRYRCYRNVYRNGLMWGLPMNMCLAFGGCSMLNLFLIFAIVKLANGLWLLGLLLLVGNVFVFFVLRELVNRHGVFFIDKLIAHHFQNTFTLVRANRRVCNLLNRGK